MKVKNINTALLIALILTSCAPAVTVVSPTETIVPLSTFTSIPPTATPVTTLVPQTTVPTSEPIVSLSAEGPWLVYRYNALSLGYADVSGKPEEFVLLNQDGSGRTLITLPACDIDAFLMDGDNSANYMAEIGGDIYIFRPHDATGLLVYRQLWYSYCNTYFSGDKNSGLLASFYQASNDVSPELILYELPSGKIRERFPLIRCSTDTNVCEKSRSNWTDMMRQQPQWSPNGRYLAFVAIVDAASSDLFVYDIQDRKLRRLTNGPDWVGPIEWSPDGTHIIMQELLNDFDFLFAPYSKPPSSVWSVAVGTNEIKLLYPTENAVTEQNILFWLDDKRFFAYDGLLVNAENARDLRLVDMETSTNRILFDGAFVVARFDPIHETFALYVLATENYRQGIYLVSIKNNTIRPLNDQPFVSNFFKWDSETGLFVSEDDCQNDPQSFQTFDYRGDFKCVAKPTPTPVPFEATRYPSPDRKWTVSVKDGLWLETQDKPPILISQKTPSDIIWCLDSSCFFFSEFQPNQQQTNQWALYRVSLPDLLVKLVDEGIESRGTFQWLGVEE
jgi:hypothetical protein